MNKNPAFTKVLDDALRETLDRFEKEMARCRKHFSEKSTHDLRVSLRRLISTIDVTGAILDVVKTSKPRKTLKKSLDTFGELRDIQVRLAEAGKLKARFPEIEPYAASLINREKELIGAMAKVAGKIKIPKIKKGMRPAIKRMRKAPTAEYTQEKYFIEAFNFVDKKHHDVAQKALKIDGANIKTIHDMRVAFKKFRYSVEALKPVLGGVTADKLKEMHDFQQLMGDINDVNALIKDITRFSKTREGIQVSFDAILRELKGRYATLLKRFTGNLGALNRFWSGFEPAREKD